MELSKKQIELCENHDYDFSDLKVLVINCTLKKSLEVSHTHGLIGISKAIMEKNNVKVEEIRAADFDILPGVWSDMSKK